MNDLLVSMYVCMKNGVRRFFKEERGDTNFISILIILGVVIVLAGVFIGFKDQIIEQVTDIIEEFTID